MPELRKGVMLLAKNELQVSGLGHGTSKEGYFDRERAKIWHKVGHISYKYRGSPFIAM